VSSTSHRARAPLRLTLSSGSAGVAGAAPDVLGGRAAIARANAEFDPERVAFLHGTVSSRSPTPSILILSNPPLRRGGRPCDAGAPSGMSPACPPPHPTPRNDSIMASSPLHSLNGPDYLERDAGFCSSTALGAGGEGRTANLSRALQSRTLPPGSRAARAHYRSHDVCLFPRNSSRNLHHGQI